jgi:outer membrane protein
MLRIKWLILPVLTVLIALPSGVAAEGQNPVLADTGVLSLDLCLEMASQNNKELGESEKKVMIADGAVKEAEAGFWPTLNYQAKREQSDVAQYQVGPGYEKTDLVGGITATLPLYTGRMLENNLKLTRLQQEIAREDRRKAKQ